MTGVVAEGAQQLCQWRQRYLWQANWVGYRSTAEALKHEKYLYLAAAGLYSADDWHRVLAERLESLVSQEHAQWAEAQHEDSRASPGQTKRS